MLSELKCDICDEHDASLYCPNSACDVNNICFPCSKSFTKEGKITNKIEDVISACCPKCKTVLVDKPES